MVQLGFVRNHMLDIFLLRLIDESGLAQLSFSLTTLFREDMAFTSLLALNFTGTGNLETFLCSTV